MRVLQHKFEPEEFNFTVTRVNDRQCWVTAEHIVTGAKVAGYSGDSEKDVKATGFRLAQQLVEHVSERARLH